MSPGAQQEQKASVVYGVFVLKGACKTIPRCVSACSTTVVVDEVVAVVATAVVAVEECAHRAVRTSCYCLSSLGLQTCCHAKFNVQTILGTTAPVCLLNMAPQFALDRAHTQMYRREQKYVHSSIYTLKITSACARVLTSSIHPFN
jgi:hypothetical protein